LGDGKHFKGAIRFAQKSSTVLVRQKPQTYCNSQYQYSMEQPLLDARPPRRRKTTSTLGLAALVCLVVAWVGQSELSQFLQAARGSGYNAPYFITVLNQSMMVWAVCLNLFLLPRGDFLAPDAYLRRHGLSVRAVLLHSLYLAVVYCGSTYLWFSALGRKAVNVSIASGIYNSSVVWVFLLSLACRMETFTLPKAAGVVLALVGVGLGSVSSSSSSPPPGVPVSPSPSPAANATSPAPTTPSWAASPATYGVQLGYIEVIGSAMLYSLFEVLLNLVTNAATRRVGNGGQEVPLAVANLFTGAVGLVHLLGLSLLLWPMDTLGVEPFRWPTSEQWGLLWFNAGLGTLFNVSFCAALVLTSPLFVSVSCLLTIPLAAGVDVVRGRAHFTALQVAGMAAICAGFLCFVGLCGRGKGQVKRAQEGAGQAAEMERPPRHSSGQ
jgi:drug/metabolite transporter (DMT)-like permease